MAGRGETKTTNVSRLVCPESILMLNRAKVELPQSLCASGDLNKSRLTCGTPRLVHIDVKRSEDSGTKYQDLLEPDWSLKYPGPLR